jgi:hypothetical protein
MSQQRWLRLIDTEDDKRILLAAKNHLKRAWEWDREDPTRYPMNTSFALAEIEDSLSKQPPAKVSLHQYRTLRNPRRLADVVSELGIARTWEHQNSGTFGDALRKAAAINYGNVKQSWKVFKSITRAMETAYLSEFLGWEFLPRPKVNILHTGLNDIAIAAGLKDQTQEGFAEFLDDLCPCGITKHQGAVRQLSRRSARFRRAN